MGFSFAARKTTSSVNIDGSQGWRMQAESP
jgi:hypothetical protein